MPLRYGCDFSGICSGVQALRRLRVPFTHVFSSEVDPYAVQSIRANYEPRTLFRDVTRRPVEAVPRVDLYCASPPCQSFSHAKRTARQDSDLCFECVDVIAHVRPKYYVLENVPRFLTSDVGRDLLEELRAIRGYRVYARVLNTLDYGLPQSRKRAFIVGTRMRRGFEWPPPARRTKPLRSCIDRTNTRRGTSKSMTPAYRRRLPKRSVFVDFNFRATTDFPNSDRVAPCLLTKSGLWNVPMHRFATPKEWLCLQGFPKTFKQVVSDAQLKRQVGNSVSVDVLVAVFRSLLGCAGRRRA